MDSCEIILFTESVLKYFSLRVASFLLCHSVVCCLFVACFLLLYS